MHQKILSMAIFIEFVAGSALAIFFHLILHHAEAAYLIFGVGILLSLATYLLREDLGETREILLNQYAHAHDLTSTIAQITDPECRDRAQDILEEAQRMLAQLREGYLPLDETEFYMKGTRYFNESVRWVKAVDPLTAGWESRGALVNYYQANLRALERGVQITRIFVLEREDIATPEVQRVLQQQIRDGIDVRIAYRDELPGKSGISGGETVSSFDFAVYDEKVATEVFSHPGKYFGRKTRDSSAVAKFLHKFRVIEHGSRALSLHEDELVLPSEGLPVTL